MGTYCNIARHLVAKLLNCTQTLERLPTAVPTSWEGGRDSFSLVWLTVVQELQSDVRINRLGCRATFSSATTTLKLGVVHRQGMALNAI
jgi:hypothetical protein